MRKSVIMRRYPSYKEEDLIKGQWSLEEDEILIEYIKNNGPGRWNLIPKRAGLHRCPKSIRMRWVNYLRADINRGPFTLEEENIIINMQSTLGNRWSTIASHLPGRTDNQIKNHWTTHLKKRSMRLEQLHHVPPSDLGQHHINGSATIKSEDNNLLTMWNSEIGESFRRLFRNNNSNAAATLTSTCYGPMSLASSSSMVMGAGQPASAMSTNRHETDINAFFNLDSSSSSNPTPGNEFDWIRGILD